MRGSRRLCPDGHGALARVLFLVALVVAVALAGCGKGTDSNSGKTGTVSASNAGKSAAPNAERESGGTAQPPASKSESAGGARTSKRRGGQKEKAKTDTGTQHQGGHSASAHHKAPANSAGSGRCPANLSHEQCKAYVEQPVSHEPSYEAENPASCQKAMSRAACEEQFETEQAGKEDGGRSVAVEHCLEEESRAQCEAQLGTQLEAEREASKGN